MASAKQRAAWKKWQAAGAAAKKKGRAGAGGAGKSAFREAFGAIKGATKRLGQRYKGLEATATAWHRVALTTKDPSLKMLAGSRRDSLSRKALLRFRTKSVAGRRN